MPATPIGRAQVLQWMFFEQYSHEPYVATPRYICRHFPADHPRRAELPDRLAKGRAAFAVMEQHLSTRQFFVNDRYSIADIALYAYSHVAEDGGHDLEAYPNVREWLGPRGGAAGIRAAAGPAAMSAELRTHTRAAVLRGDLQLAAHLRSMKVMAPWPIAW